MELGIFFVLAQYLSSKGFKVHHTSVAEPVTETQISWHIWGLISGLGFK